MKFVIMGHFLLPNIRILKKWKKLLEMWYFYMCVKVWHILPFFSPLTTPKTKIWKNVKNMHRYYPLCIMSKDHTVWCMTHEISGVTNKCDEKMRKSPRDIIILHLCTTKDDHFMYGSWDIRCDKQMRWKNERKAPGSIIILHLCTTKDDHMMYGSWNIKCDRQNVLSIWTTFYPLTLLTTWKIKILIK